MSSPEVVIYGATGLTGRRACSALHEAGVTFAISGRDRDKLAQVRAEFPAAAVRVADVEDAAALASAFTGATVVLSCAGPAQTFGERLLGAALRARAHYVDIAGDQSYLHDMYVRHESTARRSERTCVLGAGLECTLGDLAGAWAAARVCGVDFDDAGPRLEPGERLAEANPLDEIAISYVFDELVLSPSGQRAVFDGLHTRGLVWHRDRWEAVAPGSKRRCVNAGSDMGEERDVVSFPGGDVITLPRHVAARSIQTFVSTSRHTIATTALRLLARAMPVLPKQVTNVLVPYVPPPEDYARTQFAVIGCAKRGATSAQVTVRGSDVYRTSAQIAAWIVRRLLDRSTSTLPFRVSTTDPQRRSHRTTYPAGMRTPSELFAARNGLLELAVAANFDVKTDF